MIWNFFHKYLTKCGKESAEFFSFQEFKQETKHAQWHEKSPYMGKLKHFIWKTPELSALNSHCFPLYNQNEINLQFGSPQKNPNRTFPFSFSSNCFKSAHSGGSILVDFGKITLRSSFHYWPTSSNKQEVNEWEENKPTAWLTIIQEVCCLP